MRLVIGICLVLRLTPIVVGVLPAGGWWGLLDVFYLGHKGFFCHLILCIIEILETKTKILTLHRCGLFHSMHPQITFCDIPALTNS